MTLPTGQRITMTLEASLTLTFWLASSDSSDSSSFAASSWQFHNQTDFLGSGLPGARNTRHFTFLQAYFFHSNRLNQ